jgi:hypothetical protein
VSTDQEYDAQVEMIDEMDDPETDHFIPNFRIPTSDPNAPVAFPGSPPTTQSTLSDSGGGSGPDALPPDFDPFDPMLDADPFGLTASMHFPTPFNYNHGHGRG